MKSFVNWFWCDYMVSAYLKWTFDLYTFQMNVEFESTNFELKVRSWHCVEWCIAGVQWNERRVSAAPGCQSPPLHSQGRKQATRGVFPRGRSRRTCSNWLIDQFDFWSTSIIGQKEGSQFWFSCFHLETADVKKCSKTSKINKILERIEHKIQKYLGHLKKYHYQHTLARLDNPCKKAFVG